MQPLRGWVSFSIPELRVDVLFRMRELVLMDVYRFLYPSECGGESTSSMGFVLCVRV